MYYPQSQITPNLYSNGELSYKSNGNAYIGYYFKTSKDQYFTGKSPQDTPNEELIINNNIANQVVETDSNISLDFRFATKNNYIYSVSKNISKDISAEYGSFLYRLSHPLGEFVIDQAKLVKTPPARIVFNITETRSAIVKI